MKSLVPWKTGGRKNELSLSSGLFEGFNRLLEDPFKNFFAPLSRSFGPSFPSVDVKENPKEVVVHAELPFVDEKDVKLTCQNGVLTIKGDKKEEREDKKKNLLHRECSYGYFSREIPLKPNLDWEKVKAMLKKGVLTVNIPKKEGARKEKTIEVKVN